MSSICLTIDRQLARTVRATERLTRRPEDPSVAPGVATLLHGLHFFTRGLHHVWRNRQYLTTVKLANMALVNVQFKLKTERVVGRPYKLKIEPTNICNTKCQLCPTGIGLSGRPKGKMDYPRYTKLIDQWKRWAVAVDLSMWGDPLIVPEIYDMIRYAHDRGIWTYLSSNLHAFKPGRGQAEQLVRSGLDLMTCSLHGASQATYERYQPGKSFDESVAKITHLLATRDRLGSSTPAVQLNFVVTRHNEHEQEAFRRLAESLGCNPVFSLPALNTRFLNQDRQLQSLGLAPDLLQKKTEDHLREWLPRDPRYVLEPYRRMLENRHRSDRYNGHKEFDCSWPWRQTVINWDGTVGSCCGTFDPKEDLGNTFEQPFGRIWNGEKYRMARRSFRRKLNADQARDNPCAECPGFML